MPGSVSDSYQGPEGPEWDKARKAMEDFVTGVEPEKNPACETQSEYDRRRAQRKYEDRRERISLAVFRTLVADAGGGKLVDYLEMAKEAVRAADALDEVLYPSDGPVLPDYEG